MHRHPRWYGPLLITLFSIAAASAFAAYKVAPSDAWTVCFETVGKRYTSEPGLWFEIGRLLLYLLLFVTTTYYSFHKSTRLLFLNTSCFTTWRIACLCASLFLAIVIGYDVFHQHFSHSGGYSQVEAMVKEYQKAGVVKEQHIDAVMKGTRLTYALFFPYSLVNFAVLIPIVAGVMLFRSGRDIHRLVRRPFTPPSVSEAEWKPIVFQRFYRYRTKILSSLCDYMRFFLLAAFIYIYESIGGAIFNTSEANAKILMFFYVVLLAPFPLALTLLEYSINLAQTTWRAPNDALAAEFREEFNAKRFVIDIMAHNPLVAYSTAINIIVAGTAALIPSVKSIPVIDELIKGS